MRENFYVFLNIHGVLRDKTYINEEVEKGNRKKGGQIKNAYKPESVEALNFFLQKLSNEYDVNLVILSTPRDNLARLINEFFDRDILKDVKKVETTKLSTHRIRGVEIKEYLKDKDDKESYCIIDGETSDILPFVNKDKIIKTSFFKCALNMEQVQKYLIKLGLLTKDEITQKNNLVKDELILE